MPAALPHAASSWNRPSGRGILHKVAYRNLIAGKEYTVSGTLMRKSTGEPLVVDGKPVTAEKTFKAEEKDGFVELEFAFDAKALAGEKLVAFEKVCYGEDVVAVHEDIEDVEQTVTVDEVPEIGTTATDAADGDKEVEIGTVEVKDVVAYRNLKPGKEYALSGRLVTKSSNGEKVVAEASKTFTPEAADGTVELVFTVDTSKLAGEELVAFETVSLGADEVATHADINDEGQTVAVKPGEVRVEIDKSWLNAEGWEQEAPGKWPRGAVVTAKVMLGEEVVKEVTLDEEHPKAVVEHLRKEATPYTVEEVAVEDYYGPDGRSESSVDEDGNVTVKLVNRLVPRRSERFLDFVKMNEDGEMLPGAVLELTGTMDFDGSAFPAVKWTTDGTPFRIDGLVPGTYTLTEVEAPVGYNVAEPITFVIDDSGTVLVGGEPVAPDEQLGVVMKMVDPRIPDVAPPTPDPTPTAKPVMPSPTATPTAKPVTPSPTRRPAVPTTTKKLSKTGVSAGWTIVLTAGMLAAGAGAIVLRRRES